MNTYNIYGPPGCGKTHYLSRQVHSAVEKYGTSGILMASFTRTATRHLAGMLPIDENMMGTIHAHCYRGIGSPHIADKHIKDWNELHPAYSMGGLKVNLDDPYDDNNGADSGDGTALYQELNVLRHRMIERSLWPERVRAFDDKWTVWKREHDYVDWTDMIEMARPIPPGSPKVMVIDEAQDCTLLEMSVLLRWAQCVETALFAGDDDQCIYEFKGSSPEAFHRSDIPEDHKRILSQSYRLPFEVFEFAKMISSRISRRQVKEFSPRAEQGAVIRLQDSHYRYVDSLVDQISSGTGSVMVLSSCSYMLQATLRVLRERGIPFHNRYRPQNGGWNPLSEREGTTGKDRILAFMTPQLSDRLWNGEEIREWMEPMDAEYLIRGAKERIKMLERDRVFGMDELVLLMGEGTAGELANVMDKTPVDALGWYMGKVLKSRLDSLRFPVACVARQGVGVLAEAPRITVGTIHSVKGGEADHVYLFPDLSPQGMREYMDGKDSVHRMMYVGATRAKHTLAVCEPFSQMAYEF